MDLPLFDQVNDLVRALAPDNPGSMYSRSHRRGVKVWFDTETATREHYEGQILARRHVDGIDGMALEIGFHSEHADPDLNEAAIDKLKRTENTWRKQLGAEAKLGIFFGAEDWRRCSEAWIEPDLDDPELAFEVASRLVDYLVAMQPVVDTHGA